MNHIIRRSFGAGCAAYVACCLAGCTSAPGPAAGPPAPDTRTPDFLPLSQMPPGIVNLPLLPESSPYSASLPFEVIGTPTQHGVTVETARGGCTSAPDGFTATRHGQTVTITIFAPRRDPGSCEAMEGFGLYQLDLPAGEANLTIDHGTPAGWE